MTIDHHVIIILFTVITLLIMIRGQLIEANGSKRNSHPSIKDMMTSPEADTLRGQGRQVAGADNAVPEVKLRDPGVQEAAQLRPSHPASLEEDAPQGILQVRGQRPEVRLRGTT